MNVFGQRERSWRKARKRAVSPIIATILLVAITVVLAAVLYVLISGLTHGPGSTPIGSAFTAGNPTTSTCGTGLTYAAASASGKGGCLAGDYIYTLTVESSTVSMSSVLFEVKTSSGAILALTAGTGGFSVMNIQGQVVAQGPLGTAAAALAMSTTLGFPTFTGSTTACNGAACTASTSLTSVYTIVIDMGTASPTGLGYSFVAVGTGSYSGTTNALSLP
jgi:flagellin-like protein